MAVHSRILAWKILWTEEHGGLQSMVLQSQTPLSMHAQYPSVPQLFTYFIKHYSNTLF